MNITVVGSTNIDLVYLVPHIVAAGETLHSTKHELFFGGKGANQAVTAGQLGAMVHFIGNVGADDFGEQIKQNLQDKGVNIAAVQNVGITGQAIIQLADSGENSIILFPGANFLVTPEQIEQHAERIVSSEVLLLQLEIPMSAVETAANIASKNGVPIILNPAPAQQISDSLLSKISILTPNETELAILTGMKTETEEELFQACSSLLQKGVGAVVVTLGAKGAYYMNHFEHGYVQANKVVAKDTTGAGDAFNGALAVGLCQRSSIKDSILYASKLSAYVVTQMGAQPAIPSSFRVKS
ncbi:ribokinase [Psychrobacillus lasiicapitis]|uniref:Ribokinase n=1 Tax=Psychrobacillus lasiicapitis TaxID=1636719 RepID=A0A544T4Y1_9BACI|nr:ribokinase [Psychrobacillus lasiicapitis]TQR12489.1 ribokinase [Psychrobacillus lasiicapitis]GGA38552.1 ribokinase [Psychrobacillus lasiicapitis]